MVREGVKQAVSKSKLSILADNDFDRRSLLEILASAKDLASHILPVRELDLEQMLILEQKAFPGKIHFLGMSLPSPRLVSANKAVS